MAVDYLGQRVRGGGLDCRLNPVLLVRAELWKLGALAGPSGRDEAGEDGSLRTGGCDGHDVRQDALKPRHFPIRACREHPLHIDAEHSACLAGARSGSSLTRVYSRIPLIGAVLPPWPRLSVLPSATRNSAISCQVRRSASLRDVRAIRSHSAAFARYSSILLIVPRPQTKSSKRHIRQI